MELRMCGDNSRKRLSEKLPLIRTLAFSLVITGVISHRVEGLLVGAEEVVELHSHFPGLCWKMHFGQSSSQSDSWAPPPDLYLEILFWAFES